MQTLLSNTFNLQIVEASVEDILLDESETKIRGVLTSDGIFIFLNLISLKILEFFLIGQSIYGSKVVITTGTFLRGKIYLGQESFPAGRSENYYKIIIIFNIYLLLIYYIIGE